MIEFDSAMDLKAKMKVVGVGGSGGNAINRMIEAKLSGVEFISMNTDSQDLEASSAQKRIQLGSHLTNGLGAGANTDVGRKAAEETKDMIADCLSHTDMVFITAGMGGGTGTGAAPIIAEIARDMGVLTVAIVTKPFVFEGKKRMERALVGLEELKSKVDTMIVIPNQRLLSIVDEKTTLKAAFRLADDILYQATKGISDLISIHGIINLDFADVKTVMLEMGDALMGTGIASGPDRAVEAAKKAIASPLLEDVSITGAQGVLINVTGGPDMTLVEVEKATSLISEAAGDDANIIFGAVEDPMLTDEISVTVIATGLNNSSNKRQVVKKEAKVFDFPSDRKISFDKPTFQRKVMPGIDLTGNKMPAQAEPVAATQNATAADLEVPTYLRRQQLSFSDSEK
jgi:cell division protein FtsZ